MESIVNIITELGSFGLLLALAGFIIYNYVKNQPSNKATLPQQDNMAIIKALMEESTKEIKSSIDAQSKRIDNIERTVGIQIHNINDRLDAIETKNDKISQHTKQFNDRLKLGPQLHKTLNAFRNRINADHIFIGSFHNGNESLTGIPYYKFDIIAERFRPDKVERDIEFAFM